MILVCEASESTHALSGFSPVPRRAAPARRIGRRRPPDRADRCRQGAEAGLSEGPAGGLVQRQRHGISAGLRRLFGPQQGAAGVPGRREDHPAEGARRPRQSDRAADAQRRCALPRGRHHRRRHRHQPLSDPDLQPEGRRPLHHARHRGVEGSRNRRAGHRPLPLSHSRQGHVLVLGAAVPPLRQEPGEVPEDGRHAQGRADHRRRSDPGLHLPGAGA